MKKYIKGLVTGILIGMVVASVPAVAENIDVLFNTVRININGIDRVQWDENIEIDDGSTAPSSILHNGTTYLPIRTISELTDNAVYWNGDSKTVAVTRKIKSGYTKNIAEKTDKYGNIWRYYTFEDTDGNIYLGVKDEIRGYERVYRMISDSVRVTDNEIYFTRLKEYGNSYYSNQAYVVKILFNNDVNTQDGEIIYEIHSFTDFDNLVFSGDYIFYIAYLGGTSPNNHICAVNYINGKSAISPHGGHITLSDIKLTESTESIAKMKYNVANFPVENYSETIIFDKTTNTFGAGIKNTEQQDE